MYLENFPQIQSKTCFQDMEKLVKALGFPAVDETKLLTDLNIWETTGTQLTAITCTLCNIKALPVNFCKCVE